MYSRSTADSGLPPTRSAELDVGDAVRKKVQHFDEAADAHFLTFSCYRRLALLSKDRPRLWLVDAIDDARGKHRFDLWAWGFMPEAVGG